MSHLHAPGVPFGNKTNGAQKHISNRRLRYVEQLLMSSFFYF